MPPNAATNQLMFHLKASVGLDTWECIQIASIIEMYDRRVLNITPTELARAICKIAPGRAKKVNKCLIDLRKRMALARKMRALAGVDATVTKNEEMKIQQVSTAANALLSL